MGDWYSVRPKDSRPFWKRWRVLILYVASLDTAVLALLGEAEVPDYGIAEALDTILQSSLWERRLNRRTAEFRAIMRAALVGRSRVVWANSTPPQRRGYFLAGVGLGTGHALDAIAAVANDLLVSANGSLLAQDGEAAILAITQIAELVFGIFPFAPDTLPDNWRDILRAWLLGQPLAGLAGGDPSNMMQFVEGGLVYRLPWAMEAIRVRGVANADTIAPFGLALDDFELGRAVPAVETGTTSLSASLLIQAGFSSRLAAIKAVADTAATFVTLAELQAWLDSDIVTAFSQMPDWPTAETASLWSAFRTGFVPAEKRTWIERPYWAWVQWKPGVLPAAGSPLRLRASDGQRLVMAPDGTVLGDLLAVLNPSHRGLLRAAVSAEANKIEILYNGPDDLWLA